ncbi:MAG TPA: DoxX family protein [Thermomicrobiales bacterium]|nr:DoxX family protein [Thermomicrobiales bacterium]
MDDLFAAYVAITLLAVAANGFAAAADFAGYQQVAVNMQKAGVPLSWMTPLGALKAAGALGLLVGIVLPPIGIAAGVGLVLFFIGAIVTHLRVHCYAFAFPLAFLTLAAAALALRLVTA